MASIAVRLKSSVTLPLTVTVWPTWLPARSAGPKPADEDALRGGRVRVLVGGRRLDVDPGLAGIEVDEVRDPLLVVDPDDDAGDLHVLPVARRRVAGALDGVDGERGRGAAHGGAAAVPLAAPDGPAKSALLSSVSCRPGAGRLAGEGEVRPGGGEGEAGPLGAARARRADRVLRDGARVLDQEAAGLGDLEVVGRIRSARVVAGVLAEDEGLPGRQLGAGAQRITGGPHARRPARREAVEQLPPREVHRRRGRVLDLDVLIELRSRGAQAQLGDDDARGRSATPRRRRRGTPARRRPAGPDDVNARSASKATG